LLAGAPQDAPQDCDPAATAQLNVAKLKKRVREDPRSALAWLDLAREYTVLGQLLQARHALENAVRMAPTSRFVLRSACAFYIHCDEPDRAVRLLRATDRAKTDAWLMAAEIAASTCAEKRPHSLKTGMRLITSKSVAPLHLSELAGAVATEELNSGSSKSAKKLFAAALVDPTENSVAQAKWASGKIRGIPLEQRHFELPRSFEARALEAKERAAFDDALQQAWRWLLDQPFSSQPASFGSYLACIAGKSPRDGVRFAEMGLKANPHDDLLRNNLAVCLTFAGDHDRARREFERIKVDRVPAADKPTLVATAGLLRYRLGDVIGGRTHYEKAIEWLTAAHARRSAAVAALHWAYEEIAADGDRAVELLKKARELAQQSDSPEVAEFRTRVEKLAVRHVILG
jgi:tetratricopeptide (TPR) repeat protein